jgi:hypothetical protein
MLHHPIKPRTKQLSLFMPPAPVRRSEPSATHNARVRGAVFTKRETVDFILDLAGYTTDKPLHSFRLLEPSFGRGDFLLPVVERLLTAYNANRSLDADVFSDLSEAIRGVEIDLVSIAETRTALNRLLIHSNIAQETAERLLSVWIVTGDFLLASLPQNFSFAVGNPPYVRQELIPNELMAIYRELYDTIYDRADLYIPFIERCLNLLEPGGTLGFICADRWMKNRYGGPLRSLVASGYHLKYYVDMVDTPAFYSEVSAYPAITVITRERPGTTRLAHRPAIERSSLQRLTASLKSSALSGEDDISEVALVTNGAEPWMLNAFDQVALVRRLERDFPSLEQAGCRVGIGVATGADRVFIGAYEGLDVEDECKLQLVTTADIKNGSVVWLGKGVINPFREDGGLVNLADYPRLAAYLEKHASVVKARNCAKKNNGNWYRTIDRIYPDIARRPKLLIPDIKGDASIVFEEGCLYPHHNLYYITSDEWDLLALQAVLKSGIARLFVAAYSTWMRGGYLRFQAQYLRRIRIPHWRDVPASLRETLLDSDVDARNRAVFELYGMTKMERTAIGGNGL